MNKPNFLLITTDQQRFDTIHALGNNHIYTPHLNWLVDEGITFERAYSDCPVCMPARATVMTGKHGYNLGLTGNTDAVMPMDAAKTLPGVLTRNGYQTRAQGKMHFTPMRANYGFEHMELPLDYYRQTGESTPFGIPKGHGIGENEIEPVISTVDETQSAVYWTVKRSIDFMETRDDTRPFFLWTSFAKPHPPFDPCRNYWVLYQNKELPPPIFGDWSETLCDAPQGFYASTYTLNNAYRMSAEQMADVKRAYYACITQIDYSLGLLFARMREMDLLDDTWIIFTADHGDMMGDHHMGAKSVFLEGSAHIPMLIKPPKAREKSLNAIRCGDLVTLADVMPTILDIAGIESASDSDGESLLKLVTRSTACNDADGCAAAGDDITGDVTGDDKQTRKDRIFFGNCNNDYLSVIENNIKYMWTSFGGEELLFDLNNDPMEQVNLIKTYPDKAASFKKLLIDHVTGYNNDLLINGELKTKPPVKSPDDFAKWPGFHSTNYPCDVLH